MEGAEQQVGAARSDLGVAVEPGRGVSAGGKFEAEYDAGRHVFEEAGVHAHDFDIADVLGIEGQDPAIGAGIGDQGAVDGWYTHHDAPVAVEIVAEAGVDPLGGDLLVRVEISRGPGAADIVLV